MRKTEFFNFVDTNHDGFITISEIKNDNLCKNIMGLQDTNVDKKLTLHEILQFNNDTKY
jgi:hypothetical protein